MFWSFYHNSLNSATHSWESSPLRLTCTTTTWASLVASTATTLSFILFHGSLFLCCFHSIITYSMIPLPTSILALIKVVALLIIQSKLLWQWSGAVTMTISFLPPPMTKHLTIMLIRSRRITLLLSSWTHETMIVIGDHLFLLRDVVWNVGSRRTGVSGAEQWPATNAASRELFRWEHHISKASQWQHPKYLPFEKMTWCCSGKATSIQGVELHQCTFHLQLFGIILCILPRRTRINAVGQLPGIRRVAVHHRWDGSIYCGVLPCLVSVTYAEMCVWLWVCRVQPTVHRFSPTTRCKSAVKCPHLNNSLGIIRCNCKEFSLGSEQWCMKWSLFSRLLSASSSLLDSSNHDE